MNGRGRQWQRKHRVFSRRMARVRLTLCLLRERKLADDYAAAFNEFDDETAEFWEGTASDGLIA